MHILFLTDNFPPEVNAPASRTYEHSREWVKSGEQVTIITCAPNFPKGKVFSGYKNKLWQTEVIDGIKVIRVWTYITANEGFFKRTLDYVSFMISAVIASFFVKKVDVVIGTSPQFFTVCAAYLVGLFKRRPWVFELRDIWPESIKTVGAVQDSRVINFLQKIEIFLYRKANAIICVTNSFKQYLIDKGIDPNKISVITNGVDSSRFAPKPKSENLINQLNLKDCFVLGYIGTHGLAHYLETIIDSAEKIETAYPDLKIKFIFLGDGASKKQLQVYALDKGISNVIFVDTVFKDEVVDFWSILDFSITHLKNTSLFKSVIPSKIFESMAMGVPILHGVQGESANIIESEDVGVCFVSEDSEDLTSKILMLVDDKQIISEKKMNCISAAKKYDRSNLAKNFLPIFKSLVNT